MHFLAKKETPPGFEASLPPISIHKAVNGYLAKSWVHRAARQGKELATLPYNAVVQEGTSQIKVLPKTHIEHIHIPIVGAGALSKLNTLLNPLKLCIRLNLPSTVPQPVF